MSISQRCVQVALGSLALLCLGAAPRVTAIAHPKYLDEALIVPHDSLVRFRGFDKYGVAHFSGRFVLTGTFFIEGCPDSHPCDMAEDLDIVVFPDPSVEARLPHWKVHNNDISMTLRQGRRLLNAVTTNQQRASLLTGKIPDYRGRISIVVDEFQTSLECDSANFSGRYLAIAKVPKFAKVEFNGNYGCA